MEISNGCLSPTIELYCCRMHEVAAWCWMGFLGTRVSLETVCLLLKIDVVLRDCCFIVPHFYLSGLCEVKWYCCACATVCHLFQAYWWFTFLSSYKRRYRELVVVEQDMLLLVFVHVVGVSVGAATLYSDNTGLVGYVVGVVEARSPSLEGRCCQFSRVISMIWTNNALGASSG